ncbi:MAG: glycosyltransferase family 9 protein [Chlamydiales bacterium]|nr:glycosyltransferase family 9 protein [Chlamydiales bacterium]
MTPLMNRPGHIAVFAAKGLGDGLLSLILANQLRLLGHRVTLYNTAIRSIRNWLPAVEIHPFPLEATLRDELSRYEHVIAADFTPVSMMMRPSDRLTILYQNSFDTKISVAKNFVKYLIGSWNPNANDSTGICIPPHLRHKEYRDRVIIHPTSGADSKNWLPEKFVQLAHNLRADGFDPVFCVSPDEAPDWLWVESDEGIPLYAPPSIEALASFVYTSGCFIGNDSGTGHLASLLHIPTISLFARKSHSRLWRPDWGPGVVVTPFVQLPGARLKQKYWKQLLSVKRVLRAHSELVSN